MPFSSTEKRKNDIDNFIQKNEELNDGALTKNNVYLLNIGSSIPDNENRELHTILHTNKYIHNNSAPIIQDEAFF